MPERVEKSEARHPVPFRIGLAAVLIMVGVWVLLVGGVKRDEMIVGAVGVTVSAFLLWLVASVQRGQQRYKVRDLAQVRRVPLEIVQDVFLLLRALAADIFLHRRPSSAFWVCGFQTSKHRPEDVARRVLVTAYTSATPNAIVIGIDYTQSRLLFHQLEKADVSTTMRELGAKV